ncbi:AAA family ATPase [Spiribacter aquaticus]|uniref:AAA family ATPase n=1 Tax=Spiribacter aquaticus TaxID=1935996 RepID=A0A557REA2_9GAMM|nr:MULTISPECIES: helicase RepA family protein [Spiribacter]KAF0279160.1 hypothetical protein BA897_00095 [Spiribacter roseus]TVO63448.1 AAA family ATPase [Spiribacter aquaticus]
MNMYALRNLPLPPHAGLRFIRAKDLKLRAPEWIVRHRIEHDSINLMFGAPSGGKSFVAIDIAASIASGRAWAGANTQMGPVLFLAGEGRDGLTRRLKAWCIRHDVEQGSLDLGISSSSSRLTEPEGKRELQAAVDGFVSESGMPGLLVVDTLARNFGSGDENSNADMGAAISALDRIRSEYGCAVLLVHHCGHNDTSRARGASSLFAAVDSAFKVDQDDEGVVRLEWTKTKDTPIPEPLAFKMRQVELPIVDDRGDPLTSAILDPVGHEIRHDQSPSIGTSQSAALDALKELKVEFARNLANDGRSPDEARVSMDDWRQRMKEHGLSRQRVSDSPQRLASKGLVCIKEGFVELTEKAGPFEADRCPSLSAPPRGRTDGTPDMDLGQGSGQALEESRF